VTAVRCTTTKTGDPRGAPYPEATQSRETRLTLQECISEGEEILDVPPMATNTEEECQTGDLSPTEKGTQPGETSIRGGCPDQS